MMINPKPTTTKSKPDLTKPKPDPTTKLNTTATATATANSKAVAISIPATLPESLEVTMELQRIYRRLYKADSNLVAISEENVHVKLAGLVSIIKYLRPNLNLNHARVFTRARALDLCKNHDFDINLDTESDLIFIINPDSDPDFTLKCESRPGESFWVYKFILEYKDVKFLALATKEEFNEFFNSWK